MSVKLTDSNEIATSFGSEVEHRGTTIEEVTAELKERGITVPEETIATIAMLRQWAVEDEQATDEEIEANRAVLRSIDENRLSERKLFEKFLAENPN